MRFGVAGVLLVVAAASTMSTSGCGNRRRKERQHREVAPMFAEIRMREEAYRAQLGRFLSTGTEDEWFPPMIPGADGFPIEERPYLWKVMGMRPPFEKMFCQYAVVAGPANDAHSMGPIGKEIYGGSVPTTSWFYAVARCDGDGDPAVDAMHVMRSDSTEIITTNGDR